MYERYKVIHTTIGYGVWDSWKLTTTGFYDRDIKEALNRVNQLNRCEFVP